MGIDTKAQSVQWVSILYAMIMHDDQDMCHEWSDHKELHRHHCKAAHTKQFCQMMPWDEACLEACPPKDGWYRLGWIGLRSLS